MLKDVLKQKNIPILGAFVDALYTASPLLSMVNFVSILIVLYESVRLHIADFAPWLTFWWFFGILVCFSIVLLAVTYKFIIPSLWTFRNNQMNVYDSVIVDGLKELRNEVAELKKKL